jgi:hypothetical protein
MKPEIKEMLARAARKLPPKGRRPDGTYLPTIPEETVEAIKGSEIAFTSETGISRGYAWKIRNKGARKG